jgi:hypothetical protein
VADVWKSAEAWDSFQRGKELLLASVPAQKQQNLILFCALVAERCLPALCAAGMLAGLDFTRDVRALHDVFDVAEGKRAIGSVERVPDPEPDHWIWDYPIGRQAAYAMSAIDTAVSAQFDFSAEMVGEALTSYFEVASITLDELARTYAGDGLAQACARSIQELHDLFAAVSAIDVGDRTAVARVRAMNALRSLPLHLGADVTRTDGAQE